MTEAIDPYIRLEWSMGIECDMVIALEARLKRQGFPMPLTVADRILEELGIRHRGLVWNGEGYVHIRTSTANWLANLAIEHAGHAEEDYNKRNFIQLANKIIDQVTANA